MLTALYLCIPARLIMSMRSIEENSVLCSPQNTYFASVIIYWTGIQNLLLIFLKRAFEMWKQTTRTSRSIEDYAYRFLYFEKNARRKSLSFYVIGFKQNYSSLKRAQLIFCSISTFSSVNLSQNSLIKGLISSFLTNYYEF